MAARGKDMDQPFAIAEDGGVFISQAEILKSQMIVSAVDASLPPDFAEKAQEKADLLERRLSDLEAEVKSLRLADDAVRQHAIDLKRFIDQLSAVHPE